MSESNRHVEVIYCDDIREEAGGKISLMGLYAGEMIVPSLPIVLPKLCILMRALTDSSDPFRKLNVHIERGEERTPLVSTGDIVLPRIQAEEVNTKKPNVKKLTVAQLHFVLSPFQIDAPTFLRVRIETERGSIKGAGLRIILPPNIKNAKQPTASGVGQLPLIPEALKQRNIASKTVKGKARKKVTI